MPALQTRSGAWNPVGGGGTWVPGCVIGIFYRIARQTALHTSFMMCKVQTHQGELIGQEELAPGSSRAPQLAGSMGLSWQSPPCSCHRTRAPPILSSAGRSKWPAARLAAAARNRWHNWTAPISARLCTQRIRGGLSALHPLTWGAQENGTLREQCHWMDSGLRKGWLLDRVHLSPTANAVTCV